MVISTGKQVRRSQARRDRLRQSTCRRAAREADRWPPTSTTSSSAAASSLASRMRRASVRASSARLRSESGSAHSCIVSPNPFGACGAHSGCRSCRRTGSVMTLTPGALTARRTATSQSCGVRNLRVASVHASSISTSAAATARRSPPEVRNTRASFSTAPAGGTSATKCVTSFVATNVAVEAWRHRSRMTCSPCSTPASEYFTPSTVRAPGS